MFSNLGLKSLRLGSPQRGQLHWLCKFKWYIPVLFCGVLVYYFHFEKKNNLVGRVKSGDQSDGSVLESLPYVSKFWGSSWKSTVSILKWGGEQNQQSGRPKGLHRSIIYPFLIKKFKIIFRLQQKHIPLNVTWPKRLNYKKIFCSTMYILTLLNFTSI